MISVAEALAFMEQYRQDFGIEDVPLLQSLTRVLAKEVCADRDFPPYHRVTMDGIAICTVSFEAGRRSFLIERTQAAGSPQQSLTDEANCIELMTGAMLPQGCDAVVPYEDCIIDGSTATVNAIQVKAYQNIHLQGTDAGKGECVLRPGQRITSSMVGVLATVGMSMVPVKRLPRVAICSTGDELVDIDARPEAHQIRRSNGYMLGAALQGEGMEADQYHLPDDVAGMKTRLGSLLEQYEVLMFSGAVSRGKYDFLPAVLEELGVTTIFHRVAQRPGKPFLFGKAKSDATIFGFPGNPASTLVCYRIYFMHWLHQSLLHYPDSDTAMLAEPVEFKPSLSLQMLVTLKMVDGALLATPCPGANSGDMVSLAKADGILMLPSNIGRFEAGEVYPLLRLDASA